MNHPTTDCACGHLPWRWSWVVLRIGWGAWSALLLSLLLVTQLGHRFRTGQLAFVSMRDGHWQIYMLDIPHNLLVNLSRNESENMGLGWSPDGNRLIFHGFIFPSTQHQVYVMDADGSHQHALVDHRWDVRYGDLAWSPNGQQIAFYTYSNSGDADIFVSDLTGTHIQDLTHDSADDLNPSWSPDGRFVAFNTNVDGNWDINVMDADGSHLRHLTDSPANDLKPSWSPDGTRLAFVSDRDGNLEIYVMDIDGSHVQRLTTDTALDSTPSWSPDGTRLAFSSDHDGNLEIYAMDVDGSHLQRLTYSGTPDISPAWQP